MPDRHRAIAAFVALVLLIGVGSVTHGQQQPPVAPIAPIAIDASEQQITQVVNAVRAGRKLTPKAWPGGARVAVGLSFDIDNELLARQRPLPVPLSQGEYGATTGLPLAMLDRQQVPATFYIPAVSAMLHPEMIPEILNPHVSGHRSRVMQLEKLVTYMKSKPGVWFATLEQIAAAVKTADGSR